MQENNKEKAPSLANWFISKLIKDGLHEEFFGDLEEIYQDRILAKGKFYARLLYWIDALHLLLGFTSFILFKTQNNPTMMFKHYLHISGRNLMRNKAYSIINVLGLAVGMGICLLICQYIYFELSYDKFHDNYQNTYRIIIDQTRNGVDQGTSPYTTYSFGKSAKEEIPEIDQFVRVCKPDAGAVVTNPDNNRPLYEDAANFFYADKAFLEVFNFPLKTGAKESVLNEIYNIVITEKTAYKYFGSDDPIGKTLKINGANSSGNYIITGVLEELPINSQFQFEFLMSMENFWEMGNGGSANRYGGWVREWFGTYLSINRAGKLDLVGKKLDQIIAKYKVKLDAEEKIVEKTKIQPIAATHLRSDAYTSADFVTNKGNAQNVQVFALIAFFILIMAWVNYINLSTAHSINRAREVGVRKSIGALRPQLMGQFMVESFLVNFIASILAIGIALSTLPLLNHIIGKELEFDLLRIPLFWLSFLTIFFFGSLLSGLYPAFVLSALKPISMLVENKTVRPGKINLRKGLIAFQFLISLLLIAATYLVYNQIKYMKNQELGMDIEKVMILKGPKIILKGPKITDGTDMSQLKAYSNFSRSTFQTFRNEVTTHPSILAVNGSYSIPGQGGYNVLQSIRKFGEPSSEGKYGRLTTVGLDFVNTYGLELIAGSPFTEDISDERVAIINEEAVRVYGFGSPENALQETLISDEAGNVKIVGVVKNFNWQSLREPHAPYIFRFVGSTPPYISFKMNVSNIPQSLAHIEGIYNAVYPNNPFDYFFLEDNFNRQYVADTQFGNLFFAFTILAIFIACTGLFALVSYSAALKMKEIGIRKVLGANIGNLLMLLSKEYLVLLSIAIILAIPAILYFGKMWLANYAFRIDIGFDILIIPALVLVVISLLTVSYRTYVTAAANPVKSLRKE